MNATVLRQIDQSTLDRIHAVVGDAGVITDENDKSPFLHDERGYYTGRSPMKAPHGSAATCRPMPAVPVS